MAEQTPINNATKTALLTRIEILEQEVADIKAKLTTPAESPEAKLEGLWKDVAITEEDFEDARRSLFRELDDV